RSSRPGKRPLDGLDLDGRQAAARLVTVTAQGFRIKTAVPGIEDHAVLDAIECVARLQETFNNQLAIGVGQSLGGQRVSLCVCRCRRVERNRYPTCSKVRITGAHGRS